MDAVSYVSDSLDLEMRKVPFGSLEELSGGFGFMPWSSADDDHNSLSYFASMFTDEASYNYFPPLTGDATTHIKTGPTPSCLAPLPNAASTLNYSAGDGFSDCLSSDTDSESGAQPNYTTFDEAATTCFGDQTDSPADAVSPPSPKRARLMAADPSLPTKSKTENKSSPRPKPTHAKSESRKPAEPSTSGSYNAISRGTSHNTQLRTASRKPKTSRKGSPSVAPTSPGLTPEELRARQSHNFVEKQYRNRLNAQFERLLAVLPTDKQNGDECNTQEFGGESRDRKMSKAEVLDMARQWIGTLELDIAQLEAEREKLLESARSFGLLGADGVGISFHGGE